jgi:phage terminase large subunit
VEEYYYQVYCIGQWGVIGKTFFNAKNKNKRLQEIQLFRAVKGQFVYDYNELTKKISNVKWQNDENGFIEIIERPKKYYPYVLAGDTAGEGSDYFTGQVLENITGRQVAKLRKEFDADEYTRQMYCLGKYYNNALIGIEANFDTYPIKYLEMLGYKNQFIRTKEDSYTGKSVKAYGFRTDRVTRPLILSELQAIVNDNIDKITDKETLEEMLVFVRNEKGKPEAQEGCHDDLVMCLAIAYYIRQQQKMNLDVEVTVLQENIKKDFGIDVYEESNTLIPF